MKEQEHNHSLENTLLIGTIALISTLAFSAKSKKIIYERDVTCRICGGVDHLSAAHIDHNKNNPHYDDPSNGRLLDGTCHLLDHINRAGSNGLTKSQNDYAIRMLILRNGGRPHEDVD